jgi:hypothetical protein
MSLLFSKYELKYLIRRLELAFSLKNTSSMFKKSCHVHMQYNTFFSVKLRRNWFYFYGTGRDYSQVQIEWFALPAVGTGDSKNSNKPLFLLRIKLHRRSEQTKIDGTGGIKIKLKTRTRGIKRIVLSRAHTYFNCFPSRWCFTKEQGNKM